MSPVKYNGKLILFVFRRPHTQQNASFTMSSLIRPPNELHLDIASELETKDLHSLVLTNPFSTGFSGR
jgi:hypothetical protein